MINLGVGKIEDIPQEAYDALMKDVEQYDMSFEDIGEIQEYIEECGDHDENIDSDYVNHDYSMVVGNYLFECYGSQYIKDQCICDEEMGENIYISNVKEKKESEKKEKEAKQNKAKVESSKKWDTFFDEINSELDLDTENSDKLKDILTGYKFPTKFK